MSAPIWTTTADTASLNGTTPIHLDLERELAELMGTEDTIVFTTGYQSNLGAISALLEPDGIETYRASDHAEKLRGQKPSDVLAGFSRATAGSKEPRLRFFVVHPGGQ